VRFGNCYTFAIQQYLKHGGWLVLRRSVKARIPHMQWGAAGIEKGAEPICWTRGLVRCMGPERGYLIWSTKGCYWRPRINRLQIVEYLPPEWCNRWAERWLLFRILPLHVIVFFGWVRAGEGEQDKTQTIIDETWPHDT
jgi:hypothetical protein